MSEFKLTTPLPELDSARLRPALRGRSKQRPPLSTRGLTIVRERELDEGDVARGKRRLA